MTYLEKPIFLEGTVVHGYGRGKKINCPTANLNSSSLEEKLKDSENGVYFGWARINNDENIYKMVMSFGYNIYFGNKQFTIEAHLLNDFESDFYDQNLRLIVNGYIRPMLNFDSLEKLLEAIENDKNTAKKELDKDQFLKDKMNEFITKEI
ncbi:riboflavin kinase [Anaeramoeba flamelloides]|uniref:riboflavin kinase n=1 Tax=Anaeramoeba flamelloides TaxID=1746091 RepID=A0AAV7YLA6_9EUKA|nr:riboflavin kinase [Anaeramoeba flamelloides]KAJ6249250.1 riboflavin kinase [Anaeramoeba flamelloides]